MASACTIFITATEARQSPLRDRAIHDEGRAIESAILDAVAAGLYETVVSDGTPMTASTPVAVPVVSIDSVSSTFYVPLHGYKQGDTVQLVSTDTLPSPFTANGFYYVIYIDGDHIKLASSLQNALSNRPVSISLTNALSDIVLTDQGSGYFSAPVVTISGGNPDRSATALARLASYGSIGSIGVISNGQGYSDVPTVSIVAQGAGAIVSTVRLKAVSVSIAVSGTNYRVGDTLTVVGGVGTAATISVLQTDAGGSVVAVSIKTPGSYSSLPSLISAATTAVPGGGTGCTLNLVMGVSTISVSQGGSGYIAPPKVNITGNGSDATAVASVIAGRVATISVTNPGIGYTSIPSVTLTSGQGASAIAVLEPTSVASIAITSNGGNTYTREPNVTVSAQGSGAVAGTVFMKVNAAVVANRGTGYVAGDVVLISGGSGTNNASIQVISVGTLGDILTYVLATSGTYSQIPILDNNSVSGGSGTAATFNITMCVDSVAVAQAGNGYTTPPAVTITSPTGYGASAIALIENGSVVDIEITANGTGYRDIPTLTITSGSGATAKAYLNPTSLSTIEMIDTGSGYSSASVTIIGNGVGAEAHAEIVAGEIVEIVVDEPGTGYTTAPIVQISGNGIGAQARSLLTPTSLNFIDLLSQGSNYTSVPTVTVDGLATARAILSGTGIDRIDITNGGVDYTSNPIVNIIPSPNQQGSVIAPSTAVTVGYSVESITIVSTGSNYRSTPDVVISAPQAKNGNVAVASASLGIGQGTLSVHLYPPSKDYFAAWKNTTSSSSLLTRPYIDRMDTVIKHFTDLGYTINRQTNPATGNTLQWSIKW